MLKLSGRITWAFFGRLILILFMIVIFYALLIFLLFNSISDFTGGRQENPRDILVEIVGKTTIEQGKITLAPDQLEKIKKRNAWVQILDEQGNEIYQYRKPKMFPEVYSPGTLADFRQNDMLQGYQIYTWWDERKERKVTWIYGEMDPEYGLLFQLKQQTRWENGQLVVPVHLLKESEWYKYYWFQVIDDKGNVVFSDQANDRPEVYPPGYFIEYFRYEANLIYITGDMGGKNWTWVLGKNKDKERDYVNSPDQEQKTYSLQNVLFYSLMTGSFLIVVVVAILFGRQLGGPILHMMNWLQLLAKGIYQAPGSLKGFQERRRNWPRAYRTYREVFAALEQLTETLQRNEKERKRLKKTREEWIAGVSHDLKTPLSSVKGYADLLSEEQYEWDREEMKKYIRVIRDKAKYMEHLIDDLNLTFRLKNEALPLNRKPENMVEVVRQAVINVTNGPQAEGYSFVFHTSHKTLLYPLDQTWFKRAIINLLMNAVIHNPPGTKIAVSMEYVAQDGRIFVRIADNGRGMDEETLSLLFERYYRGTSTKHKGAGSGLGMAISEQLLLAHDGKINLQSQLGKGTEVVIGFPYQEGINQ